MNTLVGTKFIGILLEVCANLTRMETIINVRLIEWYLRPTFKSQRRSQNYYQALDFLDALIKAEIAQISAPDIQVLHGLVMDGKKRSSPYRDGQNVIKDSASGSIIYMPPAAKDVSALMLNLIDWINAEIGKAELPMPIIAAIAHYQFVTIHPYYDANGRTARLLTNLVLHKSGYGLKGIYSLEEYYATNLQGYYNALTVAESHNYYLGREQADISGWIVYFCEGMADAFANVRLKANEAAKGEKTDHSVLFRELDQRQKQVLSLFTKSKYITTREIAELLNIHIRTALNLCKKWLDSDFIIQHGNANKSRKYELADKWLELV